MSACGTSATFSRLGSVSVFEPFSDITRGVVDGVGLPDNWPWGGPTDAELAEVLTALSRAQCRSLKKIAEALEVDEVTKH